MVEECVQYKTRPSKNVVPGRMNAFSRRHSSSLDWDGRCRDLGLGAMLDSDDQALDNHGSRPIRLRTLSLGALIVWAMHLCLESFGIDRHLGAKCSLRIHLFST
jgi:hypothetical protein